MQTFIGVINCVLIALVYLAIKEGLFYYCLQINKL